MAKTRQTKSKIYFRVRLYDYFFLFLFFVYRVVNIIIVSYFKFVFRSTNRFSCMNANWEGLFGRDENLTTIDQYCIAENNVQDTFRCNNMNIMWNIFAVFVQCAAWIRKLSHSIRYWRFQVDLCEHEYRADFNMQTQVQRPNKGTTLFEEWEICSENWVFDNNWTMANGQGPCKSMEKVLSLRLI